MEVLTGKSSINGLFSIAMLNYQRVTNSMARLSGASGRTSEPSHSDQRQAGAAEFGVAFADPEAARGLGCSSDNI
jgi:hypothetical protein